MAYASQPLASQSGAASFTSDPIPVAKSGFSRLSLTILWAAVAATAGVLSLEGTDDPTQTTWVPLTITTYHGTWPNVAATASQALVVLSDCPAFVRIRYTRSAGGGAAQFNAYATAY